VELPDTVVIASPVFKQVSSLAKILLAKKLKKVTVIIDKNFFIF
jgi:hypothetical protein